MKSYRIARAVPIHMVSGYDRIAESFYQKFPQARTLDYSERLKLLFQWPSRYTWGFVRCMEALGQEAHDLVYDFEDLQKTWAAEQGVTYRPEGWQWVQDILLAQIAHLKPDVLYLQSLNVLPDETRKELKTRFPFLKLVVACGTDSADRVQEQHADLDVVFACIPPLLQSCRKHGLRGELLYFSFDDTIPGRLVSEQRDVSETSHDFTFVGSSGYGYSPVHWPRYWVLRELLEKTNLQMWIFEWVTSAPSAEQRLEALPGGTRLKTWLRATLKKILSFSPERLLRSGGSGRSLRPGKIRDKTNRLLAEVLQEKGMPKPKTGVNAMDAEPHVPRKPDRPLRDLYPRRCREPIFGLDTFRVLQNSKVTFNYHRHLLDGCVGNIRLFEATGVGSCLLTEAGKNLSDLFEADREVVTYRSMEECLEKVNYLLTHEQARIEIARAGQRRTLKDHTIMNRCRQMDEVLQKML